MAIRRKCEGRRCPNGRRCLEHLQLDLWSRGERYRMMVNAFAIRRMVDGGRRPVASMAQTPPLLEKSPFHRFGVRLNKKHENSRDRRISREEEEQLLDAAL